MQINKPFLISGGIGPEDPPVLRNFLKDPVAKDLFAVDINSKFETSPGVKDMEKVRQFVEDIKGEK